MCILIGLYDYEEGEGLRELEESRKDFRIRWKWREDLRIWRKVGKGWGFRNEVGII